MPTLVLLAYLNAADFSRQALTMTSHLALLCILPKLPGMPVRILGINRTVGLTSPTTRPRGVVRFASSSSSYIRDRVLIALGRRRILQILSVTVLDGGRRIA